jgi:phosphoserine phosphatase
MKIRNIFKEILDNKNILNEIKKNIHVKDNILEDLEKINNISDTNLNEYLSLKNKIINVDEFKNPLKINLKPVIHYSESHN